MCKIYFRQLNLSTVELLLITMYILHVIPRSKSIGIEGPALSYFSKDPVEIGGIVEIPLRKKHVTAIVVECKKLSESKLALKQSGYSLRSVVDVISEHQVIPKHILTMLNWVQSYYLGPASNLVSRVYPSYLDTQNAQRDIRELRSELSFNKESQEEARFIAASDSSKIFKAAKNTIQSGKQVLVLYPQRVQVEATKKAWSKITRSMWVYHSGVSTPSRREAWLAARRGDSGIYSTSQSGVFLPLTNLGLVVVLYESDQAHKVFDQYPRFHTRNIAAKLAQLSDANLILSDAMPSLETSHAIQKGSIQGVLKLSFPTIPQVMDVKKAWELGNSELILPQVQQRLEKAKSAAVIVGRKGYSTYIECRDCGYTMRCGACGRALVLSRQKNSLECRICFLVQSAPDECPNCNSHKLKQGGLGDEKVVEYLRQILPNKYIIHIQSDRGTVQERFESAQKLQGQDGVILVGTPYLASLITQRISYAVAIANDSLLHVPEFNALEQFLHSISNISYRAQKLDIQTLHAQHDAYSFFRTPNDYIQNMLQERKRFGYPPFEQLVLVSGASRNAQQSVQTLYQYLSKRIALLENRGILFTTGQIDMMEPYRVYTQGRNEWRLLLKVNRSKLKARNLLLKGLSPEFRVDVDPTKLFS